MKRIIKSILDWIVYMGIWFLIGHIIEKYFHISGVRLYQVRLLVMGVILIGIASIEYIRKGGLRDKASITGLGVSYIIMAVINIDIINVLGYILVIGLLGYSIYFIHNEISMWRKRNV
ncbi:hypothetical protein [Anaeromicrobium sediminis]|uniref:Uncharacterized protein n=1 Tax=Anaeromicrobium sediminis TaxID=1478221 RepID=A0A267MQQ8_9FIRM|nr:hypothetical protein [Anaeromicrobium sediminis]PAB61070.1 hypothetical protein CCE28_01180 [Anaeromicrobium sediminis]